MLRVFEKNRDLEDAFRELAKKWDIDPVRLAEDCCYTILMHATPALILVSRSAQAVSEALQGQSLN